jgi:hypothetical protein
MLPEDTVILPPLALRVPETEAPELRVKVLFTKVVPLPEIDLSKAPEAKKEPVLEMEPDILLTEEVKEPELETLPIIEPELVKSSAFETLPVIEPSLSTVPRELVMLPSTMELAEIFNLASELFKVTVSPEEPVNLTSVRLRVVELDKTKPWLLLRLIVEILEPSLEPEIEKIPAAVSPKAAERV